MSEIRDRPERIDLLGVDDPRDVVHRAVACLAQGGVVSLPSEAGSVLVAGALCAKAVERLRAASQGPISVVLRGSGEIDDWVRNAPPIARTLSRRAWPGPVTLRLEADLALGLAASLPTTVRAAVVPDRAIHLRLNAHAGLREVCDLLSGPLLLAEPPSPPEMIDLDMIVDEGESVRGPRNSIVSVRPEGWTLDHPGAVTEAEILRMTATLVLFVCTGNTCRSPMAEALCRRTLASRLGCAPSEIERRGYAVASAGLAASHGARAAADAVAVVQARGGSLHEHSSRQLTPAVIAAADLIIAMTRDHLDAILDEHPEVQPRARLLHPGGADVADPIGCDRATYQKTAEAIDDHLRALLDDLLSRPKDA